MKKRSIALAAPLAMLSMATTRLSTARTEHADESESVTRFPRAGTQTVRAYRTSLI